MTLFDTDLINPFPPFLAISHGRGAAAKLYATIDRVPPIDSQDPSGLKPETIIGEITLENVDFYYPSRPDVQVAKDLTLRFPAGKTCALVGASGSHCLQRIHQQLWRLVRL